MEISDVKAPNHDKSECVRVAVNIRPLIEPELIVGCTDCITVVPGNPRFRLSCSALYDDCVSPLVDAVFHGYNATVLAYGQTGSGKTYTMGTNYTADTSSGGIIPKVMESIFTKVYEMRDNAEFLIRVSFIEVGKQFIQTDSNPRVPIQIRETASGGITLAGVTEAEVNSKEEMASYLTRGSIARATGSTNMNSQSSRSHAIFTINMEMKRRARHSSAGLTDSEALDLAGSERAKRTGADGIRLKEGIHINRGLLALGNVISALGDEKKRKEGGHVPYRDSKLTRLLQDSLGGNSKTVMIETINTLKYANRARNIQNKAVVNHDPVAAQMQKMRSEVEHLQSELLFWRNGGYPRRNCRISLLEASNVELHRQLKERQMSCERLAQHALDAQGKPWNEIDSSDQMQEVDLVRNYVSKIQDLEAELLRLQNFSSSGRNDFIDVLDLDDDDDLSSKDAIRDLSCTSDGKSADLPGDIESDEKEQEHSTMQERFDKELKELEIVILKAEMKRFSKADTSVLKQHYEKKIWELEHEKKVLQKEIEDLHSNIVNISSASGDGAQKLKEEYLQKLNTLESQVSELKKKQDAQSQLLRQKQKSDEAAKRLQEEIQRIKAQKVNLQHKIKQESEHFRSWKASREKEVLQLKKEGRRNEYEMHKLLALNQRQKMVLQRKTEEASLATKRLKELLEAKKISSRENSVNGVATGQQTQALMQSIEHELEVILQVHEVRSKYEKQLEARTAVANELMKLKDEAEKAKKKSTRFRLYSGNVPSARNSRISALENMLATSSSTLVSMASHLSEAEERERLCSGKTRWSQVRSLADAKTLLNYLFSIASASKCEVQDKYAACLEKDSLVNELKEKVVRVTNLLRQSEAQRVELEHKTRAPRKSQSAYLMDMDTSDSEDSDLGRPKKMQTEDKDWVESNKKRAKPRSGPKGTRRHSGRSSPDEAPEQLEDVIQSASTAGERAPAAQPEEPSPVSDIPCCSCSRSSSCKTQKCECRAHGSSCGLSCGCVASKCTNRGREGDVGVDDVGSLLEAEVAEREASVTDRGRELASQGAMLLQGAFSAACPPETKTAASGGSPCPTSAIPPQHCGKQPVLTEQSVLAQVNTAAAGGMSKARRRKNWRKSVIQLVPAAVPPAPSQSQPDPEAAPRHGISAAASGQQQQQQQPAAGREERHPAGSAAAPTEGKDNGKAKERISALPPRSPTDEVPTKLYDEKENHIV
ncbi:unnamed protein product [Spirodela intermedia]|uniref:Kinesin motor domain-containing protein n=1 Tax=Spirodela intermedia TaxID=51605 RepID=A0A7I8JBH2_SPIIN|nr:unnamed protein product [Spirodela intermedia]CAA6667527.1 unnamed protein product [Spirodela intermedia]